VVLYEALTGLAPFEADSISSIMYQTVHAVEQPPSYVNPNLDPELDAIVARALAKSPDDRFENMKAFSRKLREVIRSRAVATPYSLAQLRSAPGISAAAAVVPGAPDALGVGTVPLSIVRDVDGTRLAPAMPFETVKAPDTAATVPPPRSAAAPAEPGPSASPPPVAAASTRPPVALPDAELLPAPASSGSAAPSNPLAPPDIGQRTAWPVAVANQFDSTIATLRLAEITAQTAELSEFISASRQMPAYQDAKTQAADKPAPTANQRAAITLTMDPLPEPRKIPLPPLLLLGGLGSTVVILLVALLWSF
jgi:serine/threonine protein kinase